MRDRWVPRVALSMSVLVAVALTAGGASANGVGCYTGSTTLDTLLVDGGCFQVDDKQFDDWVFYQGAFDASNILITGLDDDPLNPGLRYDISGMVAGGSDVQTSVAAQWTFNVSVVDEPLLFIKDNSLQLYEDGYLVGDGVDYAYVWAGEFVRVGPGSSGEMVADKTVYSYKDGDTKLLDEVEFEPQKALNVLTKTFIYSKGDSVVQLKAFEQRFSQAPIPEPSAIFLFAGGALLAFRAVQRSRARGG